MTAHAPGDALQLALGLYRAPSHRFAARGLRLPAGIGQVLHLATGAPEVVAEAARVSGEPEDVLIQAARFYLQQVLFVSDADAYRMLGVTPDAPASQIRDHHRWLQRWLHPDRCDGEEAIFASRVNAAWAQLRTPEVRRAHDVRREEDPRPGHTGNAVAGRLWVPDVEGAPPDRFRLLALAAIFGCLVLVVLLARRQDPASDWSMPAVPLPVAPDAAQSDATRVRNAVRPKDAVASRPRPQPIRRAVAASSAHPPLAHPPFARIAMVPHKTAPASASKPAPLARVPESHRESAAVPRRAPAASLASRRKSQSPISVSTAAAAEVASQPRLPGIAAGSADVRAALPLIDTLPATADDPLLRLELAGNCTRQVVRYLADPRVRIPPVWNDLASQLRAQRHQRALQVRLGNAGRITIALDDPQWHLGRDQSSLLAVYRVRRGAAVAETGLLTLALVWREGMWLVRDISLEPAT